MVILVQSMVRGLLQICLHFWKFQINLSPLTSSNAQMRLILEAVFGNDTLGNANDWRKSLAFELT